MTDDRPGGPTLLAFAVAVTLGGANFLAVRYSNRELDPLWGAALRFSLAAILFVLIAMALRLSPPRGRQLGITVVYGLLSFAASYALMYWALTMVTAGVATVVLAVVPLVTALLAVAHGLERLRRRAVVGALLSLGGIGWMAFDTAEVVLPPAAVLAMLGAALCIGESVILGKRLSGSHPAMTNAVGMLGGAAALLAVSAIAGDSWILPRRTEVVLSLLYLVTLGSVGLFILVLLVMRRWTASAVAYMFVLFPIVTMLLGSVLAGEAVTVRGVTGAGIVMAGVWFGALAPRARGPAPQPGEAAPRVTGLDPARPAT